MKFQDEPPREKSGRYAHWQKCDGCGKPVKPGEHHTDDEVCGATDGPGFYLCDRKRCVARLESLDVNARRELYTQQREASR